MTFITHIKSMFASIDRRSMRKLIIFSACLVLASVLVATYIWEDQINTRVTEAGVWWPAIIIIWKALSIIIAPLSGTMTYVIAGWLYGTLWWNIYNVIGNALGITVWFWLGRIWWLDAITRLIGKKSADMVADITTKLEDIQTLIITRIVLFPFEDLVNFAGGISKIRFPVFLIISLVITTIVAIVWVWVGDVLF